MRCCGKAAAASATAAVSLLRAYAAHKRGGNEKENCNRTGCWTHGLWPPGRRIPKRTPRFIFLVVGQSRDDVPTVVQAGSRHPGSQRHHAPDFRSADVEEIRVFGPRFRSISQRFQAQDRLIRHREVGRQISDVLARGARIQFFRTVFLMAALGQNK
jgi:hypothetical protein